MLVGGRVVPSFTNNWLARNNPGRLPIAFSRYDAVTLAVSALALASWIALPQSVASGAVLMIAGVLQADPSAALGRRPHLRRPSRAGPPHCLCRSSRSVFLLSGAAIVWPAYWPTSAGIHAWTTGAVGLMTLAVMTRASLGHTGQPLIASVPTQFIYVCALVAALTRIIAAFEPSSALLYVAGFAWFLAFGGFVDILWAVAVGTAPGVVRPTLNRTSTEPFESGPNAWLLRLRIDFRMPTS